VQNQDNGSAISTKTDDEIFNEVTKDISFKDAEKDEIDPSKNYLAAFKKVGLDGKEYVVWGHAHYYKGSGDFSAPGNMWVENIKGKDLNCSRSQAMEIYSLFDKKDIPVKKSEVQTSAGWRN